MRRPLATLLSILLLQAALGTTAAGQQSEPPAAATTPPPAPATPGTQGEAGEALQDDPTMDATRTREGIRAVLQSGDSVMTASRAAELAVRTAPTVESALAASAKAKASAGRAFVGFWPRLDLQASARIQEDRESPSFDVGNGITIPPLPVKNYSYGVDVTAVYVLSDLLLTVLPRYRAAEHFHQAQGLLLRAQQLDVGLRAREAFFLYAGARAALVVDEDGLENAKAQREDIRALVEAGAQARVELMRADARVASQEVALQRSRARVAQARVSLLTLMHEPGDGDLVVNEDFRTPMPALTESKAAMIEEALRVRSELHAIDKLIDSHHESGKAQLGNQMPKLGVQFDIFLTLNELRENNANAIGQGMWAMTGFLTWSPNDAAVGHYGRRSAGADAMSAAGDRRGYEDRIRIDVTLAYESYQAAQNAMEAALAGIAAAEEAYRVRREQFRAGAAIAIDLIQQEAELRASQIELIRASVDVKIARAQLDRYLEREPG